MRLSHAAYRFPVLAMLAMVLLVACSSGGATPPSSAPDPTRAPVATPAPTAPSPSPSDPSEPSPAPPATPAPPGDSLVGGVVTTLASDGLRARSMPRISDDSFMFEPLLPLGTELYVLDGPVSASGYTWYEVAALTSRTLPSGWIASADRNGEPWIEAGAFDCPPVPTDFRSLAALPPGVGLACFPQVPITVEARLISCNCDADGSGYTPSWFFLGSGSPDLLVEPGVTDPTYSGNPDDWFALNLDPTGEHPEVLPIGEVVEVTGVFDHPAAAGCTRTEMDGEPVPSKGCRLEFAVTRLLQRGP